MTLENLPKSLSAHNLNDWFNSELENPTLVDVRESQELAIVQFPFSVIHIPMSKITIAEINAKLDYFKDKKIVALCHMGVRSYNFSKWMLDNGFVKEIWNLEEGIDGWSKYIDSSIIRY